VAESDEVQGALQDAWLGDTIRLHAGRVFPVDTRLTITGLNAAGTGARPGSGELLITTTAFNQLPEVGTRITSHHRNLFATIQTTAPANVVWFQARLTHPAQDVEMRGIRIINNATIEGNGMLLIGNVGSFGDSTTLPTHLPNNIKITQCIVEKGDWTWSMQRPVQISARKVVIRDSYIQGGMDNQAGETQLVLMNKGPGPVDIINTYLGEGTGENIFYGGGISTVIGNGDHGNRGIDGSIGGWLTKNAIVNHEERMRWIVWAPGVKIWKGRMISPQPKNGSTYIALSDGVTGSTQPSWPTTIGQTVADNGITWRVSSNSNTNKHITKSLFEIKDGKDVWVTHNYWRGMWADAQANIFAVKASTHRTGSANADCVPYHTGNVNTSGTTVSTADTWPIPVTYNPFNKHGFNADQIRINNVTYTINTFNLDANTLTLATSAGTQSNVAYTWGDPACIMSKNLGFYLAYNIVESGPQWIAVADWTNAVTWAVQNIYIGHNYVFDIGCPPWGKGDSISQCSAGTDASQGLTKIAAAPKNLRYENNLLLSGVGVDTQTGFGLSTPTCSTGNGCAAASWTGWYGDTRIRANIWPKMSNIGFRSVSPILAADASASVNKMCTGVGGGICTATNFDRNIIAGVSLTGFTYGSHYNLANAAGTVSTINFDFDHTSYGRLFRDYPRGIFKIRPTHTFAFRGDTDGRNVGPDFQQLPFVRSPGGGQGPQITVTNNSALFEYWLHSPLNGIGCSLEVSTRESIDNNLISPLDVNTLSDTHDRYPRNGRDRYIQVDLLSADTTYFYRLQCGGIYEGSFKTLTTASTGTSLVVYNLTAAQTGLHQITYGIYTRATDALTSGGTGSSINCTAGQPCQVAVNLPIGITWYRLEYPDATHGLTRPNINSNVSTTPPPSWNISGTVTPAVHGVGTTLDLVGNASATVTANASGVYSFTGLSNGSYTITPSKVGYTFTPANRVTTIDSANVTGINFVAEQITITGNWYVSVNGNDANDGTTQAEPFRTIQKAADVVQAGQTVIVMPGTYREWVRPKRSGTASNRITFKSSIQYEAIIAGSEIVTGWVQQGTVWVKVIPNSFFGNFNPFGLQFVGDFMSYCNDSGQGTSNCNTRGAVYFNRVPLRQLRSLAAVQAADDTWFVTVTASPNNETTIYANFDSNPNTGGNVVEINTRLSVFDSANGAFADPTPSGFDYITVDGFSMRHGAPNWMPHTPDGSTQRGLISTNWGHSWIIQNNLIEDSTTVCVMSGQLLDASSQNAWESGLGMGGTGTADPTFFNQGNHIIRNNIIRRCGQSGINGTKGLVGSLIENNLIEDINPHRSLGGFSTGAIKVLHSPDLIIRKNVIRRVYRRTACSEGGCPWHVGIWLDFSNQSNRISQNIIYDIEGSAIHLEKNHGPTLVDNNVVADFSNDAPHDGELYLKMIRDNSRQSVYVHNLFYQSSWQLYQGCTATPKRFNPHTSRTIGAGTSALSAQGWWYNNIFIKLGTQGDILETTTDCPPNYPSMHKINYNVYWDGAAKTSWEGSNTVVSSYATHGFDIIDLERGAEVRFSANANPSAVNGRLITKALVGDNGFTLQGIENHDGTGITVNTDINNNTRTGGDNNQIAGPLAIVSTTEVNVIRIEVP